MKKNLIGYAILIITILALLCLVFNRVLGLWPGVIVLALLLAIGLVFALVIEWRSVRLATKLKAEAGVASDSKVQLSAIMAKNIRLVLFVGGAALVTFALNTYAGLGAVVASSLVGLAAGLLLPAYAAPIYCGSFVGMASAQVFPGFGHILLAGLIAGCIYALAVDMGNGFGGKLGTMALAGCLAAMLITGKTPVATAALDVRVGVLAVICSVIAAVVTYVLNVRVLKSAVQASALVGLVGGLVLPAISASAGSALAAAVFCASFAGMSSQKRASKEIAMAFTGILAGLLFVFAYPHLGGTGGKLGTIAFISIITVRGLIDLWALLYTKLKCMLGNIPGRATVSCEIMQPECWLRSCDGADAIAYEWEDASV